MTPNTEELKPCPFCGGEAETAHVGKYAVCRGCDAAPSTLVRSELWNTRPTEEALAARVVALETALKGVLSVIDRPQSGPTICMSAEDAINSAANGLDLRLAAMGARAILEDRA